MTVPRLPRDLAADIVACGYFPEMVSDAVALSLWDEEVVAHLVHVEATFNRDEIHRHLSVLVLTPTRFIVAHTDEETEPGEGSRAITTTEVVGLASIRSVSLTQVVSRPERYRSARHGAPAETWLTVAWGTMRQIELEPAGCSDPTCEADHGYTGTGTADDLVVRMSVAADGAERVQSLVRFGTQMQRVAGTSR